MAGEIPSLRVLIVDDEPLARERARRLLSRLQAVEVVGEARSGKEALQMIETLEPDVVLLDIQMPDLDGLRVLEALDDAPAVIFSTAHEQHAVKAFELEAADYCLKPYSAERLRHALDRVRRLLSLQRRANAPAAATAIPPSSPRIPAELGRTVVRVPVEQILQLETTAGVVLLYRDDGETLVCQGTLGDVESLLPPDRFFRVSRKAIVNVDRVESFAPTPQGGLLLRFRGGLTQSVSRRRSRHLRPWLKGG